MNAALLLREIPMILYVSVLRQGIPSDDSLRFLLDSFVLMPFPTSARIVYMLCEQIVIEPLFLRFLQLYLHRRYRSIQKAPGFRRAQMGFMHKTGSAEGVKGATADIHCPLVASAEANPSAKQRISMLKQHYVGIGSIIDNRNMPFSALIFRSPPYFSVSVLMERVPKPWYSLFSLLVCGNPSTKRISPA